MSDPYAPFEPASVCDPTEKPGVQAFRAMILEEYGGNDLGIGRPCDPGKPASSLHHEGRAWDWGPFLMVGVDPPQAVNLAVWQKDATNLMLRLNRDDDELARAAGLRTIIYDHEIWIAGKGWKPYGKDDKHTTHVHFGFSRAGSVGATSLYKTAIGGAIRAVPLSVGGSGDSLADPAPPDTLPAVGKQVAAKKTPLTAQRLAEVLAEGHIQVFGVPPSCERLGVAWSQVNLETGQTIVGAYNYNWGNIKAFNWDGDFHVLSDVPEEMVNFRAYPGPVAGAADYWKIIARSNYDKVRSRFDAGDPEGAAVELRAQGYFTANAEKYGATMRHFYDKFQCHLDDEPGWGRRLAPLLAVLVIGGIFTWLSA